MQTIEQINKIIDEYDAMYNHACHVIEVISSVDGEYDTNKGIEEMSFYKDSVHVNYDDTCMGCYDSGSFIFPIEFMCMTDDDLRDAAVKAKAQRKAEIAAKNSEKEKKDMLDREQRERNEYNRLKRKFENDQQ